MVFKCLYLHEDMWLRKKRLRMHLLREQFLPSGPVNSLVDKILVILAK